MTDQDVVKLLANLRLYREQIEETMFTLDRLIAKNNQKSAFPTWLKRAVPRAQNEPKVAYRSMLASLRRERSYVERVILYLERSTGKSKGTPPPRWLAAKKSGARP